MNQLKIKWGRVFVDCLDIHKRYKWTNPKERLWKCRRNKMAKNDIDRNYKERHDYQIINNWYGPR